MTPLIQLISEKSMAVIVIMAVLALGALVSLTSVLTRASPATLDDESRHPTFQNDCYQQSFRKRMP